MNIDNPERHPTMFLKNCFKIFFYNFQSNVAPAASLMISELYFMRKRLIFPLMRTLYLHLYKGLRSKYPEGELYLQEAEYDVSFLSESEPKLSQLKKSLSISLYSQAKTR